jgi:hypothetical protein
MRDLVEAQVLSRAIKGLLIVLWYILKDFGLEKSSKNSQNLNDN